MSVVLNEYEWAEEAIRSHSLGRKPSETIGRIAKYYISRGASKSEARKMVEIFIRQCDPSASIPKWSGVIDGAVSRAVKYGIIEIDEISISDSEISIINSLKSRQVKRLAFTLICLAKYWDIVNPKNDHWVPTKDNEIMKLANINTSIKRQSAMFAELNQLGLVQFSKRVDNTSIKVCFMSDGDSAVSVRDFKDLGNQYLMYLGEPYYVCEGCGSILKKRAESGMGRSTKYCPECASEIRIKQTVASVMRKRSKA